MKHLFFCLSLVVVLSVNVFSQTKKLKLYQLPEKAYQLYQSKNYAQAAVLYTSALEQSIKKKLYNINTIDAAYNAACCWALQNKADSAFIILDKVAEQDLFLSQYPHILTDGDLRPLHGDSRWSPLISKIERHKSFFESGVDMALKKELDSLYDKDQKYRNLSAKKAKEFGRESQEFKDAAAQTRHQDSLNIIQIEGLIAKYGWMGPRKVGFRGSRAIYLVVQHAGLPVQEKYLPLMRKAAKLGNASMDDLAFLEDRVLIRQGRMQIYGSQMKTVDGHSYPIRLKDPKNVDIRRFNVGLEPMSQYLQPSKWDPVEYKRSFQNRQ